MEERKLTQAEKNYLLSPAFPESIAVLENLREFTSNHWGLTKIEWMVGQIASANVIPSSKILDSAENLLLSIKNRYEL